jgi:hypothetical protein
MQQHQKNIKCIAPKELYRFLDLQFLFGYQRLPCKHLYWSRDTDLAVPLVSQTMTRNRYDQMLGNLHVNDNSAIPDDNKDKLYKLRPLITHLNENVQKLKLLDQY